jgi:hypothetical protein
MANAHKIGDLVMARQSELGEPEKFAFGVIIDEKHNIHQYKVHWFDWGGDDGRWYTNGQVEAWKALLNEKLRD